MGAVFALFSGFYFWIPKIIGKTFNENLGRYPFLDTIYWCKCNIYASTFLGLAGMPRRIPDYPDAFAAWNAISSFGSLISIANWSVWLYHL